ncbi:alkaline phosphatase D family protein [Vibrio sp. WXL210]|uniref:alkaline phosphatase D family protein n=1 Tax=Vibrio sp. WXL210 TaxID=3450709 RepID=UPI003EC4BF73
MEHNLSRRNMLKAVGGTIVAGGVAHYGLSGSGSVAHAQEQTEIAKPADFSDNWGNTNDRIWLGGDYWANPMDDWILRDGGVETVREGGNRSVHLLTHQVTNPQGGFEMSVIAQRIDTLDQDGGACLRIGAKSDINEYRSNLFEENGYNAGYKGDKLILGTKTLTLKEDVGEGEILLKLKGSAVAGAITLILEAYSVKSGELIGKLTNIAASNELLGNIGVVSNFLIPSTGSYDLPAKLRGSNYRFRDWQVRGAAFTVKPEQHFGPVLWSMYTVNKTDKGHDLKLTGFTGPMGKDDTQELELHLKQDGKWVKHSSAPLDPVAWIATFEIKSWDATQAVDYKVVYKEKHKDGSYTTDEWPGVIQAEPKGRPLKMAAFTCQNYYSYPYEPLVNNVMRSNPDILFFSGDQIYESHGGFGLVRSPEDKSILCYLRKYYLFGWAFRDAMSIAPTICIPDDHDVLQGNFWGEGGVPMENPERDPTASVLTGFIHTPGMVNVVHKTHTSHHPAPYDAAPKEALNGITAYFGEMVYADVGFAILSDRQFKTGPDKVGAEVGVTGQDEDPLYFNPDLHRDDLQLLGPTQEQFLIEWSQNWDSQKLKAALSQTTWASLSTHSGGPNNYLKYDFDGNGWPLSGRNRAINAIRESMALHICGDTHLATLSQYGVEEQRDSNWAFAVPAISAGWQRYWLPDSVGYKRENPPAHGLPHTGESTDAFGGKSYVYAVANPVVGKSGNRYVHANEKGSGFGIVEFDTEKLTYTCTAIRYLADISDPTLDNIYPGWPVTIAQKENRGENILS